MKICLVDRNVEVLMTEFCKRNVGMAKSSDFKTEDFVVYPTHGVGKVLGTKSKKLRVQN